MIPVIQTLIQTMHASTNVFLSVNNCLSYHPGLKISHINVNGRSQNHPKFACYCKNTCLDILAVPETKLANDITDDEIGIETYFAIRKDRDSNGGGVLMY